MHIARAARVCGRPLVTRMLPRTSVSALPRLLTASRPAVNAQYPNASSRTNATISATRASSTSSHSSSFAPLSPFKTHQPSSHPGSPKVHSFYDDPTATFSFVVADPATRKVIVIDPVLDYEPSSGKISQKSVKGLAAFLQQEGYTVVRICETHVHADHLTGAYALKKLLPEQPPVYIGSRVVDVQMRFAPIYNLELEELEDAFDGFLHDGDSFEIGSLTAAVGSLPGHTPDSMGIQVGDTVFAGDSLFLPDVGTARVDFPGGNAKDLYASIESLFKLSGDFRIFSGESAAL